MVQQLKFVNGQVLSSHTLLGMWLLIHACIIKVKPCQSKGPCCSYIFLQNNPSRSRHRKDRRHHSVCVCQRCFYRRTRPTRCQGICRCCHGNVIIMPWHGNVHVVKLFLHPVLLFAINVNSAHKVSGNSCSSHGNFMMMQWHGIVYVVKLYLHPLLLWAAM